MSEALVLSDERFRQVFKNSGRNLCPHGYMRGAQDLAFAFEQEFGARSHGWNKQAREESIPDNAKTLKGLICFMGIPVYNGQGHIDLWDGTKKEPTREAGENRLGYWNSDTIWLWELQ